MFSFLGYVSRTQKWDAIYNTFWNTKYTLIEIWHSLGPHPTILNLYYLNNSEFACTYGKKASLTQGLWLSSVYPLGSNTPTTEIKRGSSTSPLTEVATF